MQLDNNIEYCSNKLTYKIHRGQRGVPIVHLSQKEDFLIEFVGQSIRGCRQVIKLTGRGIDRECNKLLNI